MIIVFAGLRKGNCRKLIGETLQLVLRTEVKYHKGLKSTKVFACSCSGRNLRNFSKFTGKSPCSPFIVKLQPGIAWKRKTKVNVSWLILSKKRPVTQVLSCKFWKSYEHDFEHLCETTSEIISEKKFVI